MEFEGFFRDKKVTLMGLGLLGRGVGDAEFLAPRCKELVVTDVKSETELVLSVERLKQFSNTTFVLGQHREEDFTHTDMVIKAAGVPLESPYIAAARAASVPVYMSTALFAKFAREAGAVLVGVTGTRGKSTVSALIHHTLKEVGKSAHLGGNIRGLSTLAMLPEVKKGDIAVLELDSWQLQGFGDLRISPDFAVFTNLLDDHLNYYQNKPEQYFWDKANIFINQKAGDKLVVGEQVLHKVQAANPPVVPVVPPPLPHDWRLQLLGEHNRTNAALAALALRMLGLTDAEVKHGLESFAPVEGRLQFIREVNGVRIYNDNNATTPDATAAALASLANEKPILILGGSDKGLDLKTLAGIIPELVKEVIFLPGTGTEKLKSVLLSKLQEKNIHWLELDSMNDIVVNAFNFAEHKHPILFSPGFASFGMFKNEYDRNDQFMAAVQSIE